MITAQEYAARRQRFLKTLSPNSVAIVSTNPEYNRTQDINFYFRPNGNFYYLTGFDEPEAVAVFIPGRAEGEYLLFNRTRDPKHEIWEGRRAGQEGAVRDFGADQSFPISDLDTVIIQLLAGKKNVYYPIGHESGIGVRVVDWCKQLRKQVRAGVIAPDVLMNVNSIIHEMRLIKSEAEIAVMRRAGAINVAAHTRAMEQCCVGLTEAQLCSEIVYVYGQNNCLTMAYEAIVATGNNACVLHYRAGKTPLQTGELVLIDMGEECEWYASDVTRTFPVNGKFSPEQKAVYQLVLDTQMAILAMVKPGVGFNDLQTETVRLITTGLVKLGLLQGDIETLIDNKAYFDFYPHRVSHWIGLDAHDVSDYKINGEWRPLEAGMALTVEPGIYIQPDNQNVDARWRGIGVRIEDDVIVTTNGCENLTGAAPKTIADIEKVMQGL